MIRIRLLVLLVVALAGGDAVSGAAADRSSLTVAITAPAPNAYVGGMVPVAVAATDSNGVAEVRFYKNGRLIGSDSNAPYGMTFNFNADPPDANYKIRATAVGVRGNTQSATIRVTKPAHSFRGAGGSLATNGAFFKVWAPHATNVALVGEFNAWGEHPHYLGRQGDWWYGFQPGAAAGHLYRFQINETRFKPDPYGRQMEHSAGASILKAPGSFPWTDGAWRTPAFENMILYELHVGTYVGKHDGQPYPGNFVNLLTKLDYLKGIGVNMIELLPVQEVPGPDGGTPYLGYAPTGLFAVESAYGTGSGLAYDQLKEFVNAAHRKGLGVILDVVYNHFADITGRDNWYWDYDGNSEGNDGGIYFNNQNTDWGPAPDWGRQEVREYVQANCRYWIEEFHVDGLRWDATAHIKNKPSGWESMRNILWNVRSAHPRQILIAENLPYEKEVVESGNFHSGWFVDFHHKLQSAFQAEGNADLSEAKVGINGGDYRHPTKRVIYAMSHDECRNGGAYLITEFGGRGEWKARAKARAMAALLFLSPGIPMIWQGEEFAQDNWFTDDFEHAVNWSYEADGAGAEMKNLYRAAIQARWDHEALRLGSLAWTHEDANRVLAFRRDWGRQKILVVVNFSGADFVGSHSYGVGTGGQSGQWTQLLCSQDAAFGGWEGAGNAFHEPWTQGDGKVYLNVPKFSVVAMKLK